jgi:hypothetical protein
MDNARMLREKNLLFMTFLSEGEVQMGSKRSAGTIGGAAMKEVYEPKVEK